MILLRTLSLVLTLVTFSLPGTASWANSDTSKSEFQLLKELIEIGQPVAFEDVKGLYFGSCYDTANPRLYRQSSLFVGELPDEAHTKAVIEGGVNYGGRFDAVSQGKDAIMQGLMTVKDGYTDLTLDPMTVVMQVQREEGKDKERDLWTFVRAGNVIVGYITSLEPDRQLRSRGDGTFTVHQNEIWAACMYGLHDKIN